MKKVLPILLALLVGLFEYTNSYAKMTKGFVQGANWTLLGYITGEEYVGQPKVPVHYDKNYVKIFPPFGNSPKLPYPDQQLVVTRIWHEDSGLYYVRFKKTQGAWFCSLTRSLVDKHIEYLPIPRGSVLHLLLNTLKKANSIIDFNE